MVVQEQVEQAERAKIRAEQNADALKTQSKVRSLLSHPSSRLRTTPAFVCEAELPVPKGLHSPDPGSYMGVSASFFAHACWICHALRSGCMMQGLENEYDRLLAEHDALKRRLARFDPTCQGGTGTGKKGM